MANLTSRTSDGIVEQPTNDRLRTVKKKKKYLRAVDLGEGAFGQLLGRRVVLGRQLLAVATPGGKKFHQDLLVGNGRVEGFLGQIQDSGGRGQNGNGQQDNKGSLGWVVKAKQIGVRFQEVGAARVMREESRHMAAARTKLMQ